MVLKSGTIFASNSPWSSAPKFSRVGASRAAWAQHFGQRGSCVHLDFSRLDFQNLEARYFTAGPQKNYIRSSGKTWRQETWTFWRGSLSRSKKCSDLGVLFALFQLHWFQMQTASQETVGLCKLWIGTRRHVLRPSHRWNRVILIETTPTPRPSCDLFPTMDPWRFSMATK